jgi:hypothetical protein
MRVIRVYVNFLLGSGRVGGCIAGRFNGMVGLTQLDYMSHSGNGTLFVMTLSLFDIFISCYPSQEIHTPLTK